MDRIRSVHQFPSDAAMGLFGECFQKHGSIKPDARRPQLHENPKEYVKANRATIPVRLEFWEADEHGEPEIFNHHGFMFHNSPGGAQKIQELYNIVNQVNRKFKTNIQPILWLKRYSGGSMAIHQDDREVNQGSQKLHDFNDELHVMGTGTPHLELNFDTMHHKNTSKVREAFKTIRERMGWDASE